MKCVVCDGDEFKIIRDKLRHNVPRKAVQCLNCSLISLENPSEEALDYSESDYRERFSTVIGKKTDPQEEFDIKINFQHKRVERMTHLLKPESKILEIGCSTGHFLHSIKDIVSEAIGIELFSEHAEFARNNSHLQIYEKPLKELSFPEHHFDVISMFQVFEHIPKPLDLLSCCKKILKPSGKLILEVPNVNDALLTVYDQPVFQERFYASPHHYYYSKNTLQKMLIKAGFEGTSRTVQDYTVFNPIHWILSKKPQTSQSDGYILPEWNCPDPEKKSEYQEVVNWFSKTNNEYKNLVERLSIAEHVWYEGSPKHD